VNLVTAPSLKRFLRWLDARLRQETGLYLGGGTAMLILVPGTRATKDVDAFIDGNNRDLLKTSAEAPETIALNLNGAIHTFESHLPDDWRRLAVHAGSFSGIRLKVYTLCPEDLVLMKTFRCRVKDLQDIEKLVALPAFRPGLFRRRFLEMLPVVVGQKEVHAGSFVLVWKLIQPGTRITAEKVLAAAGR